MVIRNENDVIVQLEVSRAKINRWIDIFTADLRRLTQEGLNQETAYAVQQSRNELQRIIADINYPVVVYREIIEKRCGPHAGRENISQISPGGSTEKFSGEDPQ